MEERMMTYFKSKLDGKVISDFTKQLDFDEKSLSKRVDILHGVLNTNECEDGTRFVDNYFAEYYDAVHNRYFNVHPKANQGTNRNDLVGKQLEFMANYLLFSSENLNFNDECEYSIETNNDYKNQSRSRDTSYDNAKDGNPDKLDEVLRGEKAEQYETQRLNIVTKEDMDKYSVLQELQDVIMGLRELIQEDGAMLKLIEESPSSDKIDMSKVIEPKRKHQMKKMMGDVKRNQLTIKDMFKRPISFNNVTSGRPRYVFNDNTGYYDNDGNYVLVSCNKIELSNYKHVYQLIRYYGAIKEMVDDDVDSDWRYLLWELESLIDETPLSDSERDVVIYKVDELEGKIILDKLNKDYGIEMSEQQLSRIFTHTIPKQIVETYLDRKLNWHYTFKIRGKYKQCSKCEDVKLESAKYFRKRSKDSYRADCRRCEILSKSNK